MKNNLPFARKRFGQHFLCDQNIIKKTVTSANISPDDHLIEIGPGRGALTSELVATGASLTVVEIDRDLAKEMLNRYDDLPNFRLIGEDILKSDWKSILHAEKRNKVIANLPYNISTPIFFQLVKYRKMLDSITIMVQKEVAERIGHKGEGKKLKDYGVLSVIANSVFESKVLFRVPPGAFYPKPKVDSAVIQLVPKESSLENEEAFFDFVRRSFNLRRKLLITHLRTNESALFQGLSTEDQQFLHNLRAENLSPDQYQKLFYQGKLGN